MITKKVPNPDKAASVVTRVSTLLAYVRAPQTENAEEKCTYYGARGFLAVDPDEHAQEMIDLARATRRSPDPINHYVLSWPEDERPTPAQVEEAVDPVHRRTRHAAEAAKAARGPHLARPPVGLCGARGHRQHPCALDRKPGRPAHRPSDQDQPWLRRRRGDPRERADRPRARLEARAKQALPNRRGRLRGARLRRRPQRTAKAIATRPAHGGSDGQTIGHTDRNRPRAPHHRAGRDAGAEVHERLDAVGMRYAARRAGRRRHGRRRARSKPRGSTPP